MVGGRYSCSWLLLPHLKIVFLLVVQSAKVAKTTHYGLVLSSFSILPTLCTYKDVCVSLFLFSDLSRLIAINLSFFFFAAGIAVFKQVIVVVIAQGRDLLYYSKYYFGQKNSLCSTNGDGLEVHAALVIALLGS